MKKSGMAAILLILLLLLNSNAHSIGEAKGLNGQVDDRFRKVSFVLDSLLGGYETTSLLMVMAVYFLGHCPSALEQLKVPYFHPTFIFCLF